MRKLIRSILLAVSSSVALSGCSDAEMASSPDNRVSTAELRGQGKNCERCTGRSHSERTVCAAKKFLAGLTDTEAAAVHLEYSDAVSRTKWSNTPTDFAQRAGAPLGSLSSEAQEAALDLLKTALSDAGYLDLKVVRAADNLLATRNDLYRYGEQWYYITIFGTPSTTDDWALMMTGHHYAMNVNYVAGVAYPFPYQMGIEPKEALGGDIGTYEPMADEVDTMYQVFSSLSRTQLASAYLNGQTFADMFMGPVEYATGSYDDVLAKFPTGASRGGLLVSELDEDQKARVFRAIEAWVGDFNPEVSRRLMKAYTSDEALAETYVAFAGPNTTSVDVRAKGTYMRIDGPRVWIEIVSHDNVPIMRPVHFHCIYRDKEFDYGATLRFDRELKHQ